MTIKRRLNVGDIVLLSDSGARLREIRENRIGIITSTHEHDYGNEPGRENICYPEYEIKIPEIELPIFLSDEHLLVVDERVIDSWIPEIGDEVFVHPNIEIIKQSKIEVFVGGMRKYQGKKTKIIEIKDNFIILIGIDQAKRDDSQYKWNWLKEWLIPIKAFVKPSKRRTSIEEQVQKVERRLEEVMGRPSPLQPHQIVSLLNTIQTKSKKDKPVIKEIKKKKLSISFINSLLKVTRRIRKK